MRWVDVNPRHWFYRPVLESQRMYIDAMKEDTLFEGKTYNVFDKDYPRIVETIVSEEGQKEFKVKGYKYHPQVPVHVYIDGKYVEPSKLEDGKVHLPSPIAGDKNVTIIVTGKPRIVKLPCDPDSDDCEEGKCRETPTTSGCPSSYPHVELSKKDEYEFNMNYALNEVAVCLGRTLKRVTVDILPGETKEDALRRAMGHKQDSFTIIDGVLYVSYHLNDIPVSVNYNYKDSEDGGRVKHIMGELVTPHSDCPIYNDRFFPNIQMTRAEYFVLLQRMRKSFYNRYTDRGYKSIDPKLTERTIADKSKIVGKWYAEDVLNILEEKFLDGCYVFPLYEDNTFNPDSCVTRAEAVTYLHRFTEWALERFR